MRRALAIAIAIGVGSLGLAALGGCTLLDPFETVPLKPPPGAHDTRMRVGICYDTLKSSPEQLLVAAQDQCGKNMTPVREDTDYGLKTLDVCPMLLPGRATFICQPHQ
ncbi:MAG TPA: hypothetical protein VGG57_10440 [Stellaceae bacterium]